MLCDHESTNKRARCIEKNFNHFKIDVIEAADFILHGASVKTHKRGITTRLLIFASVDLYASYARDFGQKLGYKYLRTTTIRLFAKT